MEHESKPRQEAIDPLLDTGRAARFAFEEAQAAKRLMMEAMKQLQNVSDEVHEIRRIKDAERHEKETRFVAIKRGLIPILKAFKIID